MTLAQSYLEQGQVYKTNDKHVNQLIGWAHEFITARLRAPQSSAPGDAERTAERFVFDEVPSDIVGELGEQGQIDRKTLMDTIYLPHMNMWLEMPTRILGSKGIVVGQLGFMIGQIPADNVVEKPMTICAVIITSELHQYYVPMCLMELPSFPLEYDITPNGVAIRYRPFYFGMSSYSQMTEAEFKEVDQAISDLFDALFLLTVPRAVEYKSATFGPRKAKVQKRTGKPLIEFKQVRINIGKAATRYTGTVASSAGGEPTGKRKLHRVGWFLRTYRKRQGDRPKVVAMEPFWRGDPKLGVIIKEKHYHGEAEAAKARILGLPELRGK